VRESAKGQPQGLSGRIYRARRGRGATARPLAISAMAAGLQSIQGWETVGDKGGGVNPKLNCTLIRAIQGGRTREMGRNGRWRS
jgi:hypothetical protein